MDYPTIFPVRIALARRSPDDVRQIAADHGFCQHGADPTAVVRNPRFRGFSEIWFRLAGHGYAIIRIDSQGHSNLTDREGNANAIGGVSPGAHGGVPHYHKEWIAADLFQQYLEKYMPQVIRYNDDGDPVLGTMTDGKAKATHIRQ